MNFFACCRRYCCCCSCCGSSPCSSLCDGGEVGPTPIADPGKKKSERFSRASSRKSSDTIPLSKAASDAEQKDVKERIRNHIADKNDFALSEDVEEALLLNMKDDRDVKNGQQVLEKSLKEATKERELDPLDMAVENGERAKVNQETINNAKEVIEQLKKLDKSKARLLALDRTAFAEICSYCDPPIEVYKIMAGFYILLGDPIEKLQDWPSVQSHMKKDGGYNTVQRQLRSTEISKFDVTHAATAGKIFDQFTKDEVCNVSEGVLKFYNWANVTVTEVKIRYEQEGGDFTEATAVVNKIISSRA